MLSSKTLGLCATLLTLCSPALAITGARGRNNLRRSSAEPGPSELPMTGYTIDMPIDHFNDDDDRTYQNYYWYNDTFYQEGGPVFLFDNGESPVSATALEYLMENSKGQYPAALALAKEFNGIALLWEHRYFGQSQPFEVDTSGDVSTLTADQWQYLTVEQALEDVVYLTENLQLPTSDNSSYSLSPDQTPWIFIGGSYPGARAAMIRARNPDNIYASWSSSAPVNPMMDGSYYYNPISRAFPSNCSQDVSAVVYYIDRITTGTDANAIAELQRRVYVAWSMHYNGPSSTYDLQDASSIDYYNISAYFIEGLTTEIDGASDWAFQYNGMGTTGIVCDFLETYNPNDTSNDPFYSNVFNNVGGMTPLDDGIAATYGNDAALDAYLYAVYQAQSYFQKIDAEKAAAEAAAEGSQKRDDSSDNSDPYNKRLPSWQYLVLSEFGCFEGSSYDYYQNQDNSSVVIVSQWYNITAKGIGRDSQIADYFPNLQSSNFPDQPNVTAFTSYGGYNLSLSNTMFTDGEYDPWRAFSVMSEEFDLGAQARNYTHRVPACNVVPDTLDYYGWIVPGAEHCPDLEMDANGEYATTLFANALDIWLPCFSAKNSSSS